VIRPDAIITAARGWLGTPYIHQASLKGVGCDCLGLIRGVYGEITGQKLPDPPPYSADWAEASDRETLVEAARQWLRETPLERFEAGHVVLFRWRAGLPAKHCGIATSATTMIHAHDGAAVSEVSIGPWWRRHLSHAFQF
jgi:NlpC/P60 family putative phage cell wall peptidase